MKLLNSILILMCLFVNLYLLSQEGQENCSKIYTCERNEIEKCDNDCRDYGGCSGVYFDSETLPWCESGECCSKWIYFCGNRPDIPIKETCCEYDYNCPIK